MQRKTAGDLLQTGLKTASLIGEYISLCAGPGGIQFEMDQLALETSEEIFCHGVVAGSALGDMLCRIS